MPQNSVSFTYEDYDKENATSRFNIGGITPANIAAIRTAVNELKVSTDAIVLGNIRRLSYNDIWTYPYATILDKNCQRESKWLVTYEDMDEFFDVLNTIQNVGFGQRYTMEIPTANLALLPDVSTDELDLNEPAVAAFVDAFEAVQHSPTGGFPCKIVTIRHVGRST